MANEPWNEVAYRFFQNGLSGIISLIVPGSGGASTIYSDQQPVTAAAVALTTQALSNGVTVRAFETNVGKVFVGGASVTATDDGTGNGYALNPGQAQSWPVTTTAGIYIIGTASDNVYVTGS